MTKVNLENNVVFAGVYTFREHEDVVYNNKPNSAKC